MIHTEPAPAKVNLVLHVGRRRGDGLHPICSLFASVDLADEVRVEDADADELVCPGVRGENLAARAVAAFRAAAPDAGLGPLRVTIEKRIPVAGGLAGGSADAAAVLRAANRITGSPLGLGELQAIAATLGSDVPSQVAPTHALVFGSGERLEPIALPDMALVLVPQARGLSTGDVYAELDRMRDTGEAPMRDGLELEPLRRLARGPLAALADGAENDLERAALSLRPWLGDVLRALRSHGVLAARLTGSGPTAFGLFADRSAAEAAAASVHGALVARVRS